MDLTILAKFDENSGCILPFCFFAQSIRVISNKPKLLLKENLQRVGFLAFVPALLRRLGADPEEVLVAAGLHPRGLDNPGATIPYATMGQIAKLAAERSNCPHFGLEIGERIGTASLGVAGELMRNAPTLGVALRDFAAHQHRNAHGGVAYLVEHENQADFGYAIYQPNVPGNHVICDGAARAAYNLVCELASPSPTPVMEVLFCRSEPTDLKLYRRSFGEVKLHFNAEQTGVILPLSSLNWPVPGADAKLRKILERRIGEIWHAGELDTVTHLRRVLRIALFNPRISGDQIAAQLGVSRRTLHRRLEVRGLRYQELLDETRCEYAQQLLANTRLAIGKIGVIVGYTDPSVFTRAFIRWAGMPPREWRSNTHAL